MKCGRCGAEGEGAFCAECGEPLRDLPDRSLSDRLPWILSGLSLLAFAVGITILLQENAAPRAPDAPPTGSVLSGDDAAAGTRSPATGAPGTQGTRGGTPAAEEAEIPPGADTGSAGRSMPSMEELSSLSPREAGDRLFDRAMRLQEAGDPEGRAPFFARMGVRAYRRVPTSQADADLRFHVGLLQILSGDPGAARAEADTILHREPGHLLGLLLAARAAEAAGDTAAGARWRDSLRRAAGRTELDARPEYRAHRRLLEEALQR